MSKIETKMKRVTKSLRWRQDKLLLGVLVISLALAVTIVSCTKDDIIPDTPNVNPYPTLAGNAVKAIFMAAGTGATSGIVSTSMGWLLGGLGLSDGSPDYTEELSKINQSLEVIIGQLEGIQEQLAEINQQLLILNCSFQQTSLTEQTGRIDYLSTLYRSYASTAENGGRITNATISSWVDQVLAEGQHTSQTPMGQILATMANLLVQPQSGAVRACVAALVPPEDDTFDDYDYYFMVAQFTNYYYYYQALGLMLLNEAYHYRAWEAADLANGDIYSSDSVSVVCSDMNAQLYCTKAATFTNTVYNALIQQFTIAGGPYSNHEFLMQNHSTQPLLWVKSLEDFTLAAGDICPYPLNSIDNRCGITVGRFNEWNGFHAVVYNGYTNWQIANAYELEFLLSDWTHGKAWSYLHDLGFRNMENKIILSNYAVNISLTNSYANQEAAIFIDGNTNKSWLGDRKLFDNTNAFDYIMDVSITWEYGGICSPWVRTKYYNFTGIPAGGTDCSWYTGSYGDVQECSPWMVRKLQWVHEPAWLTSNNDDESNQFRLLKTQVSTINCTENRTPKNAGNVWTMCGDDFTNWFDMNVPRPETCDIPGAGGVPCNL